MQLHLTIILALSILSSNTMCLFAYYLRLPTRLIRNVGKSAKCTKVETQPIEFAPMNEWIENFCSCFYKYYGAKKDYMKGIQEQYKKTHRIPMLKSDVENLAKSLSDNVMSLDQNKEKLLVRCFGDIEFPEAESSLFLNPGTIELESQLCDIAVFYNYLSSIPSPADRLQCIADLRNNMASPGHKGYEHRSSLLFIVERGEIFLPFASTKIAGNKSNLRKSRQESPYDTSMISDWKNTIKELDFELVKYRTYPMQSLVDESASSSGRIVAANKMGKTNNSNDNDIKLTQRPTIKSADKFYHVFVFRKIEGNSNTNSERPKEADGEKGKFQSSTVAKDKQLLIAKDFQLNYSPFDCLTSRQKSSCPNSSPNSKVLDNNKDDRLPIGIIGGGIGGSALTLALQQSGIPVVLFEKDINLQARKQGYALTIQQGISALRHLGLWDTVLSSGVTSQSHVSLSAQGDLIGAYGVRKFNSVENLLSKGKQPIESADAAVAADSIDGITVTAYTHKEFSKMFETSYLTGQFGSKQSNDRREMHDNSVNEEVVDSNARASADSIADVVKVAAPQRLNLHIPRQHLREIMINSIRSSNIAWGMNLASMTTCRSKEKPTKIRLEFENGSIHDVSAVVGADGIYSQVRQYLDKHMGFNKDGEVESNNQPKKIKYLGLIVILGISPVLLGCKYQSALAERVPPSSQQMSQVKINSLLSTSNDIDATMYLRRQIQWLDGETRVFTMPFDALHTMWQLSFPFPEAEIEKYQNNPKLLKDLALKQLQNWHEPLLKVVNASSTELISGHAAYDRDPMNNADFLNCSVPVSNDNGDAVAATDPNPTSTDADADADASCLDRPLITLLGDAAHPMSPFKGQGANQALLDAMSLAKCIQHSAFGRFPGGQRGSLSDSFTAYEQEMCPRSSVKVIKSRLAAKVLHSSIAMTKGNITRAAAAESAFDEDL